jgi:hypothetical protein
VKTRSASERLDTTTADDCTLGDETPERLIRKIEERNTVCLTEAREAKPIGKADQHIRSSDVLLPNRVT